MNKAVTISVVVLLATLGLSAYTYTVYLPTINGGSTTPGGTSSTTSLGSPGTGSLRFYLADTPHSNATLRYLLINVTSVILKYATGENQTDSTTTTSTTVTTVSSTSTSTNVTSTSTTVTNSTSSTASSNSTQSGTENRFTFVVPPSVGTNVNVTSLHGDGILLGTVNAPAGEVVGIILNVSGAEAFWTSGNSSVLKVVANGKLMVPVHFTISPNGSTDLKFDLVPSGIHISNGKVPVLSPVLHVTVVTHTVSSTSSAVTSLATTNSTTVVTSTTSVTNSTSTATSSTNSTTTTTTT
ncbi:MAG: hypothetical protein HY247_07755 [archaeon]|nr:MAG: hypothetical protein HY247_07755 [archaeon]